MSSLKFPTKPESKEAVYEALKELKKDDLPWQSGKVMAYVYHTVPEAHELAEEAYKLYLTENGLDPTQFQSLLQLEKEVIGMVADLLNGDSETVGNCTSGGTESVMLIVKTARDRARDLFPHITQPEIIIPETAHPCFQKAGHYLNVKVKMTPVDKTTFKADVEAMEAAITDQTILIAGSAPSYAHGVIDDIEAIAALAAANNLLCHVDACVGGMFLPFAKMLDYSIPAFDFSIPGVTSISCDLHKFGYVPKGCSSVIYRNKEIRQYQLFSWSDWPGYSIINPSVLSSKTGGPMAAAWSLFKFLGVEGYKKAVKACMDGRDVVMQALKDIPELDLLGSPDISLLCFASNSETVNVFELVERMKEKGWFLQAQLKSAVSEASIHLSITHFNVPHMAPMMEDLKTTVAELKEEEKAPHPMLAMLNPEMLQGLLANFTPATLDSLEQLLGTDDKGIPDNFLIINNILNTLEPAQRDKLLVAFVNKMFSGG